MIKLGKKEKHYGGCDVVSGSSKRKTIINYPSFHVNDITLPLTSKDVGKVITAVVKLRVNKAGTEIEEYDMPKKRYRASFSVMGINFKKMKKIDLSGLSDFELDKLERKEHKKLRRA